MGIREVFAKMNWSYLVDLVLSVLPAILCISIHEMSHGAAALALGDDTAAEQGRISLNPLKHIDIMGLLMLVIFKIGWAKPVSVDMRRFKNPKRGMAITALAGPASNMVLAILALFFYGLLWSALSRSALGDRLLTLLNTTAYMSIGLGIFNLIPIPPLDGSKVLLSLLPDEAYMKLMRYERYGMILLVAVIFTGVLSGPISSAVGWVYDVFFGVAEMANKIIA